MKKKEKHYKWNRYWRWIY